MLDTLKDKEKAHLQEKNKLRDEVNHLQNMIAKLH